MKTDRIRMAKDAASARHKDENGFLHVLDNPISREQVAPYWGQEIANWQELGLDPEKLYHLYRPAEELEAAKATFNRLPIYLLHQDADAGAPHKSEMIGGMGSDARFDGEYLRNSLCFTDGEAIALIEGRDMVELSISYFYEADMTPGAWRGEPYDGVIRHIRGCHVALVEEGRAGPKVAVRDAKPVTLRSRFMGIFKRRAKDEDPGKAAPAAKPATTPAAPAAADEDKEKAIRELLDELSAEMELTPEQIEALKARLTALAYDPATGDAAAGCGKDADPAPAKPEPDKAGDEDPRDALATEAEKRAFGMGVRYAERLLKEPGERDKLDREHEREGEERRYEDADPTAPPAKAGDAAHQARRATDAAIARVSAAYDAALAVRPVLGDLPGFNPARDSAEALYAQALDAMGVNRKGVPASAWGAMYRAARDARAHQDSEAERADARVASDAAATESPFRGLRDIALTY